MERRSASDLPILELSAPSLNIRVVSFTVAAEATGQCDTSNARLPA